MSARSKRTSSRADGRRLLDLILWCRLARARAMAVGEMSILRILRAEIWGCGDMREWRRSGMQPVPVQRSRMRMGVAVVVMVLGSPILGQ